MARIRHGTLVADQVTVVDLDDNFEQIEVVIVDSPAPIYFRTDEVDPEVGGDDCDVIPAGVGAALVVRTPVAATVRLISPGTPNYCVRGI